MLRNQHAVLKYLKVGSLIEAMRSLSANIEIETAKQYEFMLLAIENMFSRRSYNLYQ